MKRPTIILLILLLACKTAPAQEKSDYDSSGTVPPFTYFTLSGSPYTYENIDPHQKTVLIYFKTYCEFCQDEITMLKENMDCFNDVQFLLLSREPEKEINAFIRSYHLDDYPQIKVLQDRDKLYYQYCKAQLTPSIHIYYRNHLVAFADGSMNFDELFNYLH